MRQLKLAESAELIRRAGFQPCYSLFAQEFLVKRDEQGDRVELNTRSPPAFTKKQRQPVKIKDRKIQHSPGEYLYVIGVDRSSLDGNLALFLTDRGDGWNEKKHSSLLKGHPVVCVGWGCK